MSCEVHVRFCERRGVRLPPATRLVLMIAGDRAHAESLRHEVAEVLAGMGLRLSQEKTHVTHIDEGFEFLGFRVQRQTKRGSHRRYVYTGISRRPPGLARCRDCRRANGDRAGRH